MTKQEKEKVVDIGIAIGNEINKQYTKNELSTHTEVIAILNEIRYNVINLLKGK